MYGTLTFGRQFCIGAIYIPFSDYLAPKISQNPNGLSYNFSLKHSNFAYLADLQYHNGYIIANEVQISLTYQSLSQYPLHLLLRNLYSLLSVYSITIIMTTILFSICKSVLKVHFMYNVPTLRIGKGIYRLRLHRKYTLRTPETHLQIHYASSSFCLRFMLVMQIKTYSVRAIVISCVYTASSY